MRECITAEDQCYLTELYFLKRARTKGTCSMKIMHWKERVGVGLNTYVRPGNGKFSMFDTACEFFTSHSLIRVGQLLCQSCKQPLAILCFDIVCTHT